MSRFSHLSRSLCELLASRRRPSPLQISGDVDSLDAEKAGWVHVERGASWLIDVPPRRIIDPEGNCSAWAARLPAATADRYRKMVDCRVVGELLDHRYSFRGGVGGADPFATLQTADRGDDRWFAAVSACDLSPAADRQIAAVRRCVPHDQPLAMIGCWSPGNYYHWLMDGCTRLRLTEPAITSETLVHAPQTTRFQREFLQLLGIDPDRILSADRATFHRSPAVVASGRSAGPLVSANIDFLYQRLSSEVDSPTQRVLVRRRGNRQLENFAEVERALQPLGFSSVVLEEMALRDQIELFANAQIVVATHGAGLTNLAFCQSGASVLEIGSAVRPFECFYLIAHHRRLNYRLLIGEATRIRHFDAALGIADCRLRIAPRHVVQQVEALLADQPTARRLAA